MTLRVERVSLKNKVSSITLMGGVNFSFPGRFSGVFAYSGIAKALPLLWTISQV